MTSSKFYVVRTKAHKECWDITKGYIHQQDGIWLGIHRDFKIPEHWNIVHLATGLKVNNEIHLTIASAKDALPQHAKKVQTYYKDFRKEAKHFEVKCNNTYTRDNSMAAMFWKLWPNGVVEE